MEEQQTDKPYQILLAEDDRLTRTLLERTLLKAGYEVTCAENGETALNLLENWPSNSDSRAPSLILIDIQMPGMDGFETTRRIRHFSCYSYLPILALTADVVSGIHEAVKEAGMND